MQLTIYDVLNEIKNDSFKEYHKRYPNVYKKFVELTFETRGKGFNRFSARGVFQVMRWLTADHEKIDGYKFNNNFTPYYVRLLEYEYPEFIGFFEKRKIKQPRMLLN
jgi:hypothetical protein